MNSQLNEPGPDALGHNVTIPTDMSEPKNVAKQEMTSAESIAESNAAIHSEKAKQEKQNTFWRRLLFWSVGSTVIAMALANLTFIVWYARSGELSPVVLSTWIVGSVAQVIGLLLVITRHLFPMPAATAIRLRTSEFGGRVHRRPR